MHRHQVNTALAFHQLISPISRSGSIIIKSAVKAVWFPNHILTRYPSLQVLQMDPFSPYVSNPDHRVKDPWLGTPYVMQSCYELFKEQAPEISPVLQIRLTGIYPPLKRKNVKSNCCETHDTFTLYMANKICAIIYDRKRTKLSVNQLNEV